VRFGVIDRGIRVVSLQLDTLVDDCHHQLVTTYPSIVSDLVRVIRKIREIPGDTGWKRARPEFCE
jgi:hypothetical protein